MINQKTYICIAVVTGLLLLLSGCGDTVNQNQPETKNQQSDHIISGQYIVVLNSGKTLTKAPSAANFENRASANRGVDRDALIQSANNLLADVGVQPDAVMNYYSHALSGFSVKMDEKSIQKLKKDPRVKFVEPDRRVKLEPFKVFDADLSEARASADKGDVVQADFVPYGITRVGGAVNGSGEFAWVIDTGIDLDHSDLNVNTQYSESFVGSEPSPNDQNGHGTHVAGTIGAVSNGYGVVGVSPGTTLFAVKVLDRNGNGSYSNIIAGVDYVAQYAFSGEVANLSLGGPASTALDNAIRNCADAGVKISLAAGNESTDANSKSPARVNHPNVRTVSAIDSNDNFASFSNYANPPIDWAAPGVGVWSTWTGDQYNKISGTSMASPHVGGLMVTGTITSDGFANGDPDGNPDPIAIRN
ncbi:MAG: S8 family serine peptidase [Balneolaceae bacterium]|nr:S8 family serine peptidase [Balneolaceae bacterium]